jgi:hypothetical protein
MAQMKGRKNFTENFTNFWSFGSAGARFSKKPRPGSDPQACFLYLFFPHILFLAKKERRTHLGLKRGSTLFEVNHQRIP